jgi:hypothetical protein
MWEQHAVDGAQRALSAQGHPYPYMAAVERVEGLKRGFGVGFILGTVATLFVLGLLSLAVFIAKS